VGDICDEDELKTGYRAEGSYYSIFWWLIKMGTAFASFVAGALIVLTAFDETQVTKVDSLSGMIREIRSEIQSWGGDQVFSGTNTQLLEKTKTQVTEALNEAKEYVSYLEKKSVIQPEQSKESVTEHQNRQRDRLLNALSQIKAAAGGLEELELRLEHLGPQAQDSQVKATVAEAIPLTFQTKFEKARMYSFELTSHLESKSKESKNSVEHYQEIITNITTLNDQLASLNAASSLPVLDNELTTIEKEILPLTKQSPYTLLMMRVVEIGLPLLLGIFSIFFLLRYSLTEKRSQEIKNLLKQRNEERLIEANKATGSAIG